MHERILLVRHGRSAHVAGGWLDVVALRRWFEDYDRAALAVGERPPEAACALAREAGVVVASDLPRARASAALLCPERAVVESPLLREVPVPFPEWSGVRLPLVGWALATGMRAGIARLRRVPPDAAVLRQAGEASTWLAGLATTHGSVLAVTHGAFRSALAGALRTDGWTLTVQGRRWAHWGVWELRR